MCFRLRESFHAFPEGTWFRNIYEKSSGLSLWASPLDTSRESSVPQVLKTALGRCVPWSSSKFCHAVLMNCSLFLPLDVSAWLILCVKPSAYTFQPGKILLIVQLSLHRSAFPVFHAVPSWLVRWLGPCCPCHREEVQQWWCGINEIVRLVFTPNCAQPPQRKLTLCTVIICSRYTVIASVLFSYFFWMIDSLRMVLSVINVIPGIPTQCVVRSGRSVDL